jgi:predicted nucleotidyltransferase
MPSMVREESYNSVKVFWLEADRVIVRLRRRAEALVRENKARRIVLFGSLAEGRAVPGSDADLLIVVDDDTRPLKERVAEYLGYFSDIGIPVDVFPYTVAELATPVARNALDRGIVLASRQ